MSIRIQGRETAKKRTRLCVIIMDITNLLVETYVGLRDCVWSVLGVKARFSVSFYHGVSVFLRSSLAPRYEGVQINRKDLCFRPCWNPM